MNREGHSDERTQESATRNKPSVSKAVMSETAHQRKKPIKKVNKQSRVDFYPKYDTMMSEYWIG